ncbi:MAG: MBL fold metallo-hydrolase, partial [Firmicutes bacterium]|nr:MBL fold metallo-hydrolase [Bacillota bacterium]
YIIKYVIVTHFHPDHCYGLDVLEKQHIIGSKYALETLRLFEQDGNDILIPSTYVQDELIITFYDHFIHIKTNPGHSKCGTVITVDDTYILTGDELMATNDFEMCLPYVAVSIKDHINSLTFIQNNHQGKICLPSHGNVILEIKEEISKRLAYLNFASLKIEDIEEFYQDKDYRFLNNHWHKSNIE